MPVTDGHLAAVFVSFASKPSKERILELWQGFEGRPQKLGAAQRPEAVPDLLRRRTTGRRPGSTATRERGMGITVGRLREDRLLDCRFVCLSHNTMRGAAGGAVLTAELLKAEGHLQAR